MFRVEYELLPKSVTQMFTKNKDIHSHNTRNRNLLRMSTGTKNFSCHSSRIWNAIASKISINISLSPVAYLGFHFGGVQNFYGKAGAFARREALPRVC